MDHPEGARETGGMRLGFDRRVRLEFHGSTERFSRSEISYAGFDLDQRYHYRDIYVVPWGDMICIAQLFLRRRCAAWQVLGQHRLRSSMTSPELARFRVQVRRPEY